MFPNWKETAKSVDFFHFKRYNDGNIQPRVNVPAQDSPAGKSYENEVKIMKKLISMIMAVCMIATLFAGCSGSLTERPTDTTPSTGETTVPPSSDPLYTVEITIPASSFEGKDMSNFDPKLYASEHGYLSAVLNEDGSVTVTMSQTKRTEYLKKLAAYTERQLSGFIEATGTPYLKDIEHNEDFSEIKIMVDRGRYKHAFDLAPLGISMAVGTYQAFLNQDYHVEIFIIDAETGEEIDHTVYTRDR